MGATSFLVGKFIACYLTTRPYQSNLSNAIQRGTAGLRLF